MGGAQELRLLPAEMKDADVIHRMKYEAFLPLYERYRDDVTNPAKEPPEKVIEKLNSAQTDYFLILLDETPVGAVRVDRAVPQEYRISPLFVLPAYQNQGIGFRTINMLFEMYEDAALWRLSTIKEEQGNCHLYEKCGFRRVGTETQINPRMTLVSYEKQIFRTPVLNLHGYHGSPQNAAFSALQENGCTAVTSPAVDYDAVSPAALLEQLRALAAEKQIGIITGTSLGGFYAAVLAAELHLPVLLVNPCLMPFLHLPRLGYPHDIRAFLPFFGELSALAADQVCCIVGGDDEVIDTHDFAKHLFGNPDFRIIPGGRHSGFTLPLKDYFREMLQKYAKP